MSESEKVNRMDQKEAEQRRGMYLTIDVIWILHLRRLKLSEPWGEDYDSQIPFLISFIKPSNIVPKSKFTVKKN